MIRLVLMHIMLITVFALSVVVALLVAPVAVALVAGSSRNGEGGEMLVMVDWWW